MIEQPAPPRRGLGRGLELLIGPVAPSDELVPLPIGSVHVARRQPRKQFDGDSLAGLAESVRVQGVVQPILVRRSADGEHELIAGERRLRAARAAGLPTVPAIVREVDDRDSLLLALVENVAREDLSPTEEARAYAVLVDEFALSLRDIAERVGRSKPAVSNRLRLLELPDEVLELVDRGRLTEGHARAVLAVPDADGRRRLARRIARQALSVRAAERAARSAGARRRPRRPAPVDPVLADRARSALEQLTGASVRIVGGRLELAFTGETELSEIVEGLETAVAAVAAEDERQAAIMAGHAGD
jgi:ParB family chromosome partitioning protein